MAGKSRCGLQEAVTVTSCVEVDLLCLRVVSLTYVLWLRVRLLQEETPSLVIGQAKPRSTAMLHGGWGVYHSSARGSSPSGMIGYRLGIPYAQSVAGYGPRLRSWCPEDTAVEQGVLTETAKSRVNQEPKYLEDSWLEDTHARAACYEDLTTWLLWYFWIAKLVGGANSVNCEEFFRRGFWISIFLYLSTMHLFAEMDVVEGRRN